MQGSPGEKVSSEVPEVMPFSTAQATAGAESASGLTSVKAAGAPASGDPDQRQRNSTACARSQASPGEKLAPPGFSGTVMPAPQAQRMAL